MLICRSKKMLLDQQAPFLWLPVTPLASLTHEQVCRWSHAWTLCSLSCPSLSVTLTIVLGQLAPCYDIQDKSTQTALKRTLWRWQMTHLEASCDVSGFPLLSPRQDVSSELFLKRGYHISKEDLDKGYGCSDSVKRPNAFVAVRGDQSIVRPLE